MAGEAAGGGGGRTHTQYDIIHDTYYTRYYTISDISTEQEEEWLAKLQAEAADMKTRTRQTIHPLSQVERHYSIVYYIIVHYIIVHYII